MVQASLLTGSRRCANAVLTLLLLAIAARSSVAVVNRAQCAPLRNTDRCSVLMNKYKGLGCVACYCFVICGCCSQPLVVVVSCFVGQGHPQKQSL